MALKRAKRTRKKAAPTALVAGDSMASEVRELVLAAREQVARAVNAGMTMLYWQVGSRIHREILQETRAEYGTQIVSALAAQLEAEFGPGFGKRNLFRMVQFAETFPDRQIVSALLAQLGWTHFTLLISIPDPLKREFYAEMCRVEKWSTRTLQQNIAGMLYERTALSRKPEKLIAQELEALRIDDKLTPDMVFRDPYMLDFLGLKDTYSERDLESAIIREVESFILELGGGFCFVARQKRMQIDHKDYHLDLLFYHRKLRRLVAVELKLGEFEAADKGQMELYPGWLKKHETEPDDAAPLGIILCAGKNAEHMELLELDKSGIHVAEYHTALPAREVLEAKLHRSIALARQRLSSDQKDGG